MPRQKPIPLYEMIKRKITEQITTAVLAPGEVLPTRTELAARYNTAVTTVDRALQELVREGLIVAGSGRRTIVADASTRKATTIAVLWNWPCEQMNVSADFVDPLFTGIRMACVEFMLEVHYRSSEDSCQDVIQQTGAQGCWATGPKYQTLRLGETARIRT